MRIVAFAAFLFVCCNLLVWQHFMGMSALPDARLAEEAWRVLSVAPIADDQFLLSVKYPGGDIRTYRLAMSDPKARDAFLEAAQAMKKGRQLSGRAGHSRAGLPNDSSMEFSFRDLPDIAPKGTSP